MTYSNKPYLSGPISYSAGHGGGGSSGWKSFGLLTLGFLAAVGVGSLLAKNPNEASKPQTAQVRSIDDYAYR